MFKILYDVHVIPTGDSNYYQVYRVNRITNRRKLVAWSIKYDKWHYFEVKGGVSRELKTIRTW